MEFKEIPIDKIKPNPFQSRRHYDLKRTKALANSINNLGCLIQPIPVRPNNNGDYERMAGNYRYKALKMLFRTKIPCLVGNFTDEQMMMGATAENTVRTDLNVIERAKELKRILKSSLGEDYMKKIFYYNFTLGRKLTKGFDKRYHKKRAKEHKKIKKILKIVDIPPSTALMLLTIQKMLSKFVKERIEEGNISMSHAYQIARLSHESDQKFVLKRVVQDGLSSRQTRSLVNEVLSKYKPDPKKEVIRAQGLVPNITHSFFYHIDKTFISISRLMDIFEKLDEDTKKKINSKLHHFQKHLDRFKSSFQ